MKELIVNKEKSLQSKPEYVYTAEDILKLNLKKVAMLCNPILQKKGIAVLSGSSDSGKSFWCLDLALAICSNEEKVFGLSLEKNSGSVIFVCTEDDQEDMSVRMSGLISSKNLNKEKLRFIFDYDSNLVNKLNRELEREPADVVIMDTFGDLFDGSNLNSSIDVRKFFKPYKKLAIQHKCLFLFCHHIGKAKENSNTPNKSDVLGSSAIESAARTVLMLKKQSSSTMILTSVKGNHISDDFKNKGMVFDFSINAGFVPNGKTIDFLTSKQKEEDEIVSKALVLYSELKSLVKVTEELRKQGHKIGKSKVHKIIKQHSSLQKPSEEDNTDIKGEEEDNSATELVAA